MGKPRGEGHSGLARVLDHLTPARQYGSYDMGRRRIIAIRLRSHGVGCPGVVGRWHGSRLAAEGLPRWPLFTGGLFRVDKHPLSAGASRADLLPSVLFCSKMGAIHLARVVAPGGGARP